MRKRSESGGYSAEMFPGLSGIPVEREGKNDQKVSRDGDDKSIEKQIDDLVGVFSDPIIVYPSGWEDTLPETLKQDITIHRLLQLMKKGEEDMACFPEVCAYMYTLTLEQPVASEWVNIYMYVMTQYKGDAMPADIRQDSLTKYEMGLLNDFRCWIFKRRREASREKLRAARKAEREAKKAEKEAQQREIEAARPGLF